MMLQEKKAKQLEEKLMTLQEEYQALKNLFELDGLNFEKSEKFKYLLEENEKNKKLKILYFEQKSKLEIAKKSLEDTKQKYEQHK